MSPQAWIFQSSPAQYDLSAALRELREFTWLANQHAKEIHPNDRVFLWETGQAAGIVAVGTVLTEPEDIEESVEERRFSRRPEDSTGKRLMVRLRVDRLVQPRLLRTTLLADPVLANLPNIKFANGTNFMLDQAQEERLARRLENWVVSALPGFAPADFQVLIDHPRSEPWDELAPEAREAFASLRAKLVSYADWLVSSLVTATRLKAFTSHPNPSGRNPLYQWCCVYPEAVPNKSDGFQLFLIVKPEQVELGFGSGAATGGNVADADSNRAALQVARTRLRTLAGDPVIEGAVRDALGEGFLLRPRWLGEPPGTAMPSFDAWAKLASGPDGAGAAISRFWSRADVLAMGDGFAERLRDELARVAPLLDAVYRGFGVLQAPPMPAWTPNACFEADAERFRAFRQTPQYAEDEVDYKASLQVVLRRALSAESLARSDLGTFLQRVIDRKVTAEELGLAGYERQVFERWNYKQTWVNLNGSPMAASAIMGALHAWAGSADVAAIAALMGDLVRGQDPAPARIDRFCESLNAAFSNLYAGGYLKAASAPRMSLTFAASILGLVDPDHCTLWRADVYQRAAEDFELALPAGGATAADKYAASIAMQTTIREALRARDIDIRDLLEVHDFLWVRAKTWPEIDSSGQGHANTTAGIEPIGEVALPAILRRVAASAGLWFESWVLEDLYLALRTKPFLILTGLSGTGKTKVALALQNLLSDPDTRAFVSVRPDWVDGKSLLGYHNLLTDAFVATPTTRLLLNAEAEYKVNGKRARPFTLLLDEMNLARVEHYLADYLSVLESRRLAPDGSLVSDPIALHSMGGSLPAAGDGRPVPPTVTLAPNVYLIGTVNIDETTHPFSRKVLDRANVVELFDVDLTRSGRAATEPISDGEKGGVRAHFTRGGSFVDLTEPSLDTPWLAELISVNAVLARDRMHFGYRVRNEALAFIEQAGGGLLGEGMNAKQVAFDLQLLQKILPKLAGSRERLERPLRELLSVCLTPAARLENRAARLADDPERLFAAMAGIAGGNGWSAVDEINAEQVEAAEGDDDAAGSEATAGASERGRSDRTGPWPLLANEVRYPRSARKIARMLLQLRDEGYSSFFE